MSGDGFTEWTCQQGATHTQAATHCQTCEIETIEGRIDGLAMRLDLLVKRVEEVDMGTDKAALITALKAIVGQL